MHAIDGERRRYFPRWLPLNQHSDAMHAFLLSEAEVR